MKIKNNLKLSNTSRVDKLFDIITSFENINSINCAKEYLKEHLGIDDQTKNSFIGEGSFISIIDKKEYYVIRLYFDDECITFSYNKDDTAA